MDWKKEYISCEKGICKWAEKKNIYAMRKEFVNALKKRIFIFEKKMIRRLNGARR